jgi:hypothetical protein
MTRARTLGFLRAAIDSIELRRRRPRDARDWLGDAGPNQRSLGVPEVKFLMCLRDWLAPALLSVTAAFFIAVL